MAAPLIPAVSTEKAEPAVSQAEEAHRERIARVNWLDAEMAAINRGGGARLQSPTKSSSGIEQLLSASACETAKVETKKSIPTDLHPKVKSIANSLTRDAAALLSLVVKADEAYRGAQLIDLSSLTVKNALAISEKEAIAARTELEHRGLVVFRDDGSGRRGFVPRV